jgi:hypothetical protein
MVDLTCTVKVRQVGATIVITIPAAIRRAWQLRKGMRVRVKPKYVEEHQPFGGDEAKFRLVSVELRKA